MSPNLGTDDVTKTDEFSKKVKKGEGRGGINLNLSRKKWNVIFGKWGGGEFIRFCGVTCSLAQD